MDSRDTIQNGSIWRHTRRRKQEKAEQGLVDKKGYLANYKEAQNYNKAKVNIQNRTN